MKKLVIGFIGNLPNASKKLLEKASLIEEEIAKTEKIIGKEKTKELVSKLKNEAILQGVSNSDYLINNLRKSRLES